MVEVRPSHWNTDSTDGQLAVERGKFLVAGVSVFDVLSVYASFPEVAVRARKLMDLPARVRSKPASPPQRKRRLTSAEVAQLVAEYQDRATVYELAARYGIHRDRVARILKDAGVEPRYHERADVDLKRADELHADGLNLTEIAKVLGVARSTLVKARREARP